MATEGAVHLPVAVEALRPLVAEVVQEALAQLEAARAALGHKLAWSEPEAAALVSLRPHQLRDARLRGEVTASGRGPGRKILYTREDLLAYLTRRRSE